MQAAYLALSTLRSGGTFVLRLACASVALLAEVGRRAAGDHALCCSQQPQPAGRPATQRMPRVPTHACLAQPHTHTIISIKLLNRFIHQGYALAKQAC